MLGLADVAGAAGVVGATDVEMEAAGLTLTEGAVAGVPLALGVAVPAAAGETETPGTGVAEAAGAGVCPWINSRLRLLGVFAFRA